MYCPEAFKLTDPAAIRAAMAENPLASFATNGDGVPTVTHLPLVARDEDSGLVLYGHFARANPHAKVIDGKTAALAVFSGPQGYISPGWYATKQETGKVVPTWNYVIVHARGVPELLSAGRATRDALELQTGTMEAERNDPWHVDDAPESYTKAMMRGIVAFRMVVDKLDAKAKLSQNRTSPDFSGTIDGLTEAGADRLARAMTDAAP